jgi:two-component system NtrC family response regulator
MRDTDRAAFRAILIGDGDRRDSIVAGRLPLEAELEFASLEASLGDPQPDWASFDVILLDAASSGSPIRGRRVEEILRHLLGRDSRTKVITLLGRSDKKTEALAGAAGTWDIATPTDRSLADRVRAVAALRQFETNAAMDPLSREGPREMIGTSAAIRKVFSLIRQVARTDVPVLISGESGTGKELAALAIHERSRRAGGPFVPINCAAIPEDLVESELFGYERGAFTGATRANPGIVETAHGGTLFLDEIGEFAPGLQAKLLRFLENHVVERVGGRKRFSVDVRIIAATNRDLSDSVEEGYFRDDLYYRLAVFPIEIPPLRHRSEDILLIAQVLLRRYARECGRELRGFGAGAMEALWKCDWPGNVRELINRIRRAVVVTDGPLLSASDLGFEVGPIEAPMLTLRESKNRAEIDCIRGTLARCGGNRTRAARVLGISRSTLYELLDRHELR